MCDAKGCVRDVDASRSGTTPRGQRVTIGLCVKHRQAFDSNETITTSTGQVVSR